MVSMNAAWVRGWSSSSSIRAAAESSSSRAVGSSPWARAGSELPNSPIRNSDTSLARAASRLARTASRRTRTPWIAVVPANTTSTSSVANAAPTRARLRRANLRSWYKALGGRAAIGCEVR